MRHLGAIAWVGLMCASLQGCLVGRTISDVTAHESYNSYKVQTLSMYFAGVAAWQEWQVWSCHRDGDKFRCREVDYEHNAQGIARPERPPATAPAPQNPAPAASPVEVSPAAPPQPSEPAPAPQPTQGEPVPASAESPPPAVAAPASPQTPAQPSAATQQGSSP